MASNYPAGLDTISNLIEPAGTDSMATIGPHNTLHQTLSQAVRALEAKVGSNLAEVGSHEQRLNAGVFQQLTIGGATQGANGESTHNYTRTNSVGVTGIAFGDNQTINTNIGANATPPVGFSFNAFPKLVNGVGIGDYSALVITCSPTAVSGTAGFTSFCGLRTHFDFGIPGTGTLNGITTTGIFNHCGYLANVNCVTHVGYEYSSANLTLGAVFTEIAFRVQDGQMNVASTVTDTWMFQLGKYKSQHMGNLGVGGSTVSDAPLAKLHIKNAMSEVRAAASLPNETEIMRRSSVQFNTATPLRETTIHGDKRTTDNTIQTITFGGTVVTVSEVAYLQCRIVARTTDGSAGAAWTINTLYNGITGTLTESAGYLDALKPGSASTWGTSPIVTAFGIWGVRIQGGTGQTVDWHATLRVLV